MEKDFVCQGNIGGRPIAKPSQIDEWIVDLNQIRHDTKIWTDKGIGMALKYELNR